MSHNTLILLLERLDGPCAQALESAAAFAGARGHYEVQIEHLLIKLLEDPRQGELSRALHHCGVDADQLWQQAMDSLAALRAANRAKPVFSAHLLQWFERAWLSASLYYGGSRIGVLALLDALVELAPRLPQAAALAVLESIPLEALRAQGARPASESGAAAAPVNGENALALYTVDFTDKAERGEIDPVLGRNDEIRKVIDILSRRRKNNPILVGEPGVGKTAVVEGLARRIIAGEVPEPLKTVRLHGLDLGLLQAGASVKGEFERRLKQVIEEVKQAQPPVILFIDEAHTLIGAGGEAGLGDAANLLKPALARGEMRTLAATTWSEYKRYFERDAALDRRFQLVQVDEPDEERAMLMLSGLKERYQQHHGVLITDDAVVAAVQLSSRYIAGRQLPDKAIDLLDTAAARICLGQSTAPAELEAARERQAYLQSRLAALAEEARQGLPADARLQQTLEAELCIAEAEIERVQAQWQVERDLVARIQQKSDAPSTDSAAAEPGEAETDPRQALKALQTDSALVQPEVNAAAVAGVVADWTGVPVGRMLRDQALTLLEFESRLGQRVVGQDGALARIGQSLRAAKAGLRSPEAPLGVFLLTGPSGVGKTETARAIAEELFGGERSLVTINLSEYQEAHTVSQLKGSPPGYVGYGEGGVLTEAVRQRPYSVVLLDEVEKAHPDVLNLFYQVFDRGVLRDGEGREIDFRNTVIVLTSNLGAAELMELCRPPVADEAETNPENPARAWIAPSDAVLIEALRPLLLRHLAPALLARMQIVPFRPLDREALKAIVLLKLEALAERLRSAHRMELRCQPAVVEQLTAECELTDSGARHLNGVIEQRLLPGVAHSLLGYMAEDRVPDILSLERDEEGALSCLFADYAAEEPVEQV